MSTNYKLNQRQRTFTMKSLLIIWIIAVAVALGSIASISAQINQMIAEHKPLNDSPAATSVPVHTDEVITPAAYQAPLSVPNDGYNSQTDALQTASGAQPLETNATTPETSPETEPAPTAPQLPARPQRTYAPTVNSDFDYAANQ